MDKEKDMKSDPDLEEDRELEEEQPSATEESPEEDLDSDEGLSRDEEEVISEESSQGLSEVNAEDDEGQQDPLQASGQSLSEPEEEMDFDIDLLGEARARVNPPVAAATAASVTSGNNEHGQRPASDESNPGGKSSLQGHRLLPRKTLWTMLLTAVLVGGLLSFSLFYAVLPTLLEIRGISMDGVRESNGPSVVINPRDDLSVFSAVAQKAMPSVVGITTVQTRSGFFSGSQRSEGLGTGVIVDERGYILTNSHVILDGQADEVMVLLHDGSQLPAEVLWHEQAMDLAVIKIDGGIGLIPAELGDSDQLIVGEIVVAIGNPLGLNFERTLTQGVVSGLNRSIPVSQNQVIDNLIQTDASINPGNSGGPLLNAQGQVIGINTAKMRTGEGLGFAIPINTAKPIVDQFIERGEFRRVYLGIRGFNAENVEGATGIPIDVERGVYIVEVVPSSAAEAAGLQPGDVVIRLGEVTVNTMGNLIRELYKYRPGDETTVTYVRNGQEETVEIVLQD